MNLECIIIDIYKLTAEWLIIPKNEKLNLNDPAKNPNHE